MKTLRRSAIKKLFFSLIGLSGAGLAASAETTYPTVNEDFYQDNLLNDLPFSIFTRFGNLVYISGHGARIEGGIREHTDNALKMIEAGLKQAGSSMDKVLKVSVFLENMEDFNGMNEVYRGRFGAKPPARTTVAVPKGLPPADHLIQIDCIGYI